MKRGHFTIRATETEREKERERRREEEKGCVDDKRLIILA